MQSRSIRAAIHVSAVFAFYLAFFMLIPAVADLVVDHPDWQVFALSAGMTAAGALLVAAATRDETPMVTPRFAFILVNALWITFSFVGAIPLYLSTTGLSFADAVFESVSGITTTGSTVIAGLDNQPPGLLLWRSLLQWLGGLGVIALGLFLLPYLNIGGSALFRIESSERADRPVSRFRTFIISMIWVYVGLTLACGLLYAAAGMDGFDAANHAMTTLSTGGFGTHDTSFGAYTPAILWIGTVFMAFGAFPFSLFIYVVARRQVSGAGLHQVKVFLGYTAALSVALGLYVALTGQMSLWLAITHASFNMMSLVTTTGFASFDYQLWGPFALAVAFVATILGGCSGSTAGGVKTYRWIILFQMLGQGLQRFVYPNAVRSVRSGEQVVDDQMQQAVALFLTAFMLSWGAGTILLAGIGLDFVTAITGALTALCNVGPGLGAIIGPAGNFVPVPDSAKWVLSFLMLLGRLEILTVIVVLTPMFWRG